MAKTPAILIPGQLAPQVEVFAKSVKAVTDHLFAQAQGNAPALGQLASIQAQLGALAAAVAALQKGGGSTTTSASIVAAQVISAGLVIASQNGRAVVADAVMAPSAILGVALTSGAQGATITYATPGESAPVATSGLVTDAPCWLAQNGAITQALPATGNLVFIGYADSGSSLVVQPVEGAVRGVSNLPLPIGANATGEPEWVPFPLLPSPNAIAAFLNYVAPLDFNVLLPRAFGLTLHGTLTLHGNAVFV